LSTFTQINEPNPCAKIDFLFGHFYLKEKKTTENGFAIRKHKETKNWKHLLL